jgi:hypothetical protein
MIEPVFAQVKFNRKIDRSNEEAGPPHGQSGDSSPRPTTC